LIKDVESKEDFEADIKKIQDEFEGLIDEDAAAFLLVDKLGFNKASVVVLSDVHPGQEATVKGKITCIQPPHEFSRKNGRQGKVANLLLSDDTATIPMVLWNEDVSLVETGRIQLDSVVKIINGYSKQGRNGTEIHVGRYSSVQIEDDSKEEFKDALMNQGSSSSSDNIISLQGTILSISPTTVFFKKDESYGFVSNVSLKTTEGIRKITFWNDQVKQLQEFDKGDTITLSYLDIKLNNGEKEYHVNGKAVINRS
jgi:replication factor A1